MANYLIDWNCKLLADLHEIKHAPAASLAALSYLQSKFDLRAFCFAPTFRSSSDSVAAFLLRRDKTVSEILDCSQSTAPSFSKPIRLLCGSSVLLEKDLHETLHLHRLAVPFDVHAYLPIVLPMSSYADWIDLELNRLLYRRGMKLMFLSFEIACIFYPTEVLERLIRIDDAIFQFNYASVENPAIRSIIKKLIAQSKTVIFGTSLNAIDKIYHYELDWYLACIKRDFLDFEAASLLKFNRAMPKKHPKSYRIV